MQFPFPPLHNVPTIVQIRPARLRMVNFSDANKNKQECENELVFYCNSVSFSSNT
jgi:hypothetical protein